MWIANPKYNKKYPGYFQLSGGWDGAQHQISFDVGTFEPIPDGSGFKFVAKATELDGFKKLGDWKPGLPVVVELFSKTYKLNKNVGDQWVDVDTEPTEVEKMLCDFLSSEAGKKYSEKTWKGKFLVNDSKQFIELYKDYGISLYLKSFEEVGSESDRQSFLTSSSQGVGVSSGKTKASYTPVLAGDQAASQLKFIREFYKEAYKLEELPGVIETAAYYSDSTDPINVSVATLLNRCLKFDNGK